MEQPNRDWLVLRCRCYDSDLARMGLLQERRGHDTSASAPEAAYLVKLPYDGVSVGRNVYDQLLSSYLFSGQ